MKFFGKTVLLFGILLLIAAGSFASGNRDNKEAGRSGRYGINEIRELKAQMLPLESRGDMPGEKEEELLRYFAPAGLPGSFRLAYFISGGRKLALYHFRPDRKASAGFIYLFHGYLDHTLCNIRLIAFLLEQGYEVVGFDLPGHGLSEGDPVDIDDFSEYAAALGDLIDLGLPGDGIKPSVIAHSTGCSMILEYLRGSENSFDRIILASPLVYTVGWWVSGIGIYLAKPFTDHVFRRFSNSTQDKDYADFVKNRDPFQSREVPFSWVDAYLTWNRDIRSQPVREDLCFHILQGKRGQCGKLQIEYTLSSGKLSPFPCHLL